MAEKSGALAEPNKTEQDFAFRAPSEADAEETAAQEAAAAITVEPQKFARPSQSSIYHSKCRQFSGILDLPAQRAFGQFPAQREKRSRNFF